MGVLFTEWDITPCIFAESLLMLRFSPVLALGGLWSIATFLSVS